jgi:hypothetical protein
VQGSNGEPLIEQVRRLLRPVEPQSAEPTLAELLRSEETRTGDKLMRVEKKEER